jgi:hypothetical protein
MVERPALNPMHQFPRLSGGGDAIEPPPRTGRHIGKIQHPPGQHVAAAKVVQQPGVEVKIAKGGLNGGEVEHGRNLDRRFEI